MKVAVISDTHDRLDKVRKMMGLLNKMRVKTAIHLGDIVSPFVVKELNFQKVFAVFGNNDGDKEMLQRKFQEREFEISRAPREIEIDGRKILLMHEPHFLQAFAESKKYRVILYGHTHRLEIKKGMPIIINPGEVCGWVSGKASFVVMDFASLEYEIFYI